MRAITIEAAVSAKSIETQITVTRSDVFYDMSEEQRGKYLDDQAKTLCEILTTCIPSATFEKLLQLMNERKTR